jgi:hypothetical protein
MTGRQTTPGRRKGTWRRLVPLTAFLFVFGSLSLVCGAFRRGMPRTCWPPGLT